MADLEDRAKGIENQLVIRRKIMAKSKRRRSKNKCVLEIEVHPCPKCSEKIPILVLENNKKLKLNQQILIQSKGVKIVNLKDIVTCPKCKRKIEVK